MIDILMYTDFIFLMSHGTVRNLSIHAYGGMALFALFVVHHILNGWFYKTVTKGKYNSQRILLSSIDWVLMVLMIMMAVSSVFAIGAVFEWSSLRFTQFWRTVHLMSTSWGYMVMSFHLALHVHSPLKKLDGKVQSKIGKILSYIIYVLVILAGCFAFYKTQLYFYLFNTGNWKNVRDTAIDFAEHYNADGGDATVVDLPKAGITGNSHFMFRETNNREIADHIEKWLKERGL